MSLKKFALAVCCVVLVAGMSQAADDLGQDAADGTAEALYNAATGELLFDVGSGIGVIGLTTPGMIHGNVNSGSIFGNPGQNAGNVLAYFNTSGLAVGEDSVGMVLPTGLTADAISFSYTPIGAGTVNAPVTMLGPVVPEPSTLAMLGVVAAFGLCWRRRRA